MNYDGKLNATQRLFFAATKPAEELYDVNADPHEIRNLATDTRFTPVLREMRATLDQWMTDTRDLGAVPEEELIRRGLVVDKLPEYNARVKPLEIPLTREP
jgi:N-sulfoglucosamine sulfohydrolase